MSRRKLAAVPKKIFEDEFLASLKWLDDSEKTQTQDFVLNKLYKAAPDFEWQNANKALRQLVGTHLNFDILVAITPTKFVAEFIQYLANEATIRVFANNRYGDCMAVVEKMKRTIFQELLQLKSIVEINCGTVFIFISDVIQMGSNLPLLKDLNVKIYPEDPTPYAEDLQNSLLNLKTFRFSMLWSNIDVMKQEHQTAFTLLAVEKLFKIEKVGTPGHFVDYTPVVNKMTCRSKIHNLSVKLTSPENAISGFHNFPCILNLTVQFDQHYQFLQRDLYDLQPMLKFDQLKRLELRGLQRSHYLRKFLKTYCSSLTSLKICGDVEVSLHKVIASCPHLTLADFNGVRTIKSEKREGSFPNLKSLSVNACWEIRQTVNACDLSMSGLHVEKLVLYACQFEERDLFSLGKLVRRAETLQAVLVLKLNGFITGEKKLAMKTVDNLTRHLKKARPNAEISVELACTDDD